MKTAITPKSLCIMRAGRLTSLPRTASGTSTPCWPVWQWRPASTGSTTNPKATYTAVSNQVRAAVCVCAEVVQGERGQAKKTD